MKSFTKSSKFHYCIFTLIVIFSLINIICTFTLTKKNYMSDEIWSYGLANSYYDPFIFADGDVTVSRNPENYKNINSWFTADTFKDYIVVNEGEAFSYDSVWYNQDQDVHPPFYYAILHTICSFFPETFSLWFGFSINIVAFLLVAIYLYKLALSITGSKTFSLMSLAFYTFNSVAVDTFIFIRMYALVTVFYVALLYYVQKLFTTKEPTFRKNFFPLLIVTCLGALTHYHFLIFAFLVSGCVCFYYLFTKKWRTMFAFGGIMLLAVLVAFVIFPSALKHVTISLSGSAADSFEFNFNYIIALVLSYQTGFEISPFKTMFGTYFFVVLSAIIFITIPTWFIFRNESWMHTLQHKMKHIFSSFLKNVKHLFTTMPPLLYMVVIVLFCMLLFYAKTLAIPLLYRTAIRYLFPVVPIYFLLFYLLLYFITTNFHLPLKGCKIIFLFAIIFFALTSNLFYKTTYGFPDTLQVGKTLNQLEEDSTCIIALSEGWLLTCYPFRLLQVGNISAVDLQYLFEYPNELENLPNTNANTPIYLILDTTERFPEHETLSNGLGTISKTTPDVYTRDDFLEYFSSLPYAEQFTLVGQDSAFSSVLEIYQLR